jgi:molecular chaperone GrpE
MVNEKPDESQIESEMGPAVAGEDVAALKKELAELKARVEANLAGWQRAQADFVNYKRRTEEEREETVRLANASLVLSLLPILDDFERAVASCPQELSGLAWVEGIRLIERKLRASLEAQGLSPIPALGEPFDPRRHEAVRQAQGKEGIVLEEVQKGYKFRDRVLRPTQVVVGSGEGHKETGEGHEGTGEGQEETGASHT